MTKTQKKNVIKEENSCRLENHDGLNVTSPSHARKPSEENEYISNTTNTLQKKKGEFKYVFR
jgi:hypothetical protein